MQYDLAKKMNNNDKLHLLYDDFFVRRQQSIVLGVNIKNYYQTNATTLG